MQLTLSLPTPGCADGTYRVEGASEATLYWANADGALPDWSPLAIVPPNGSFPFTGGRAIPPEATHVLAQSAEDSALTPLPFLPPPAPEPQLRLVAMSDLHLSRKPDRIRRALTLAQGADAVLLAGDLVNDGDPAQFGTLAQCIREVLPDTPVLAVTGNHDQPPTPIPQVREGVCDYPTLQQWLLDRLTGWTVECDPSGAYAARWGDVEIIGLNAVSHWRRFAFRDGLQWLEQHLQSDTAARRILLCHAPTLAHNPQRTPDTVPYLNRDKQLQRILDDHSGLIFLAGHTHIAPCSTISGIEHDGRSVYINCGSICTTTLKTDEPLWPKGFTYGNIIELQLCADELIVTAIPLHAQRRFSRGYYRFPLKPHVRQ